MDPTATLYYQLFPQFALLLSLSEFVQFLLPSGTSFIYITLYLTFSSKCTPGPATCDVSQNRSSVPTTTPVVVTLCCFSWSTNLQEKRPPAQEVTQLAMLDEPGRPRRLKHDEEIHAVRSLECLIVTMICWSRQLVRRFGSLTQPRSGEHRAVERLQQQSFG